MSAKTSSILGRTLLGACAAAAFGLAAAASANAQPGYDRYDDDPAIASTLGGVTVIAPRRAERDPATGAPIERVSAHRIVRYDDLDLRRDWGVRALHARIERAARSACDELDSAYPITASDSPPCVRDAVRRAMYEVPVSYSEDEDRDY
jgi:UrcA family protein